MTKSNTLTHRLNQSFNNSRNKRAITFYRNGFIETELSYDDLMNDASRVANELTKQGIEKGDRVVFYLDKCVFFVIAHIAVQLIGAVGVPLNPGLKKAEIRYLLSNAEPKLAFVDLKKSALIKEVDSDLSVVFIDTEKPYHDLHHVAFLNPKPFSVDIDPDDPALIIYTSGTTGKPKGAVLTQNNLSDDAIKIIDFWEIDGNDVLCHALPLFHIHGLCFALHTILICGGHILMIDVFSVENVMGILADKSKEYRCSVFMAVPLIYKRLLDYQERCKNEVSHIRLWASGSAPLLPKEFERIKAVFGKEPVEREGMTETGMNFSNPLRGKRKPGSIGIPLPGVKVKVVNPGEDSEVMQGGTGEFWLKGSSITPGYWRNPEETAKAFSGGWFKTGDLGHMDSDGYYFLTDRIKNIIISGGENISPKEIEMVINDCNGVAESAVVGIPNDNWGEMVVAAVVKQPGSNINDNDLDAFCKQYLMSWKCPKKIIFIEDMPRNSMGKILSEKIKGLFDD